jgi:hypothetical protein
MEKVEGNRVDAVLVRLVQRTQRVPISEPARLQERGTDLAVMWTHPSHWTEGNGDFFRGISVSSRRDRANQTVLH